MKLNNEEDIH